LVDPGDFVLPELGEELGRYAGRKLAERGIEIRPKTKIKAVSSNGVSLSDGTHITTRTLVWTAGTSPHPLLEELPLPKERQRLKVNAAMAVEGYPGIWALGDCAMIPDEHGGYQPPTAQHASREGKVLAHNIVAYSRGKDLIPFRFNTLGLLASIGRRTGVARILGVNFSGFVAWWLWRTIYLLKLPRLEKKLRVALDWTLDVVFSKDFVQYLHQPSARVVNTPIASSDSRVHLDCTTIFCCRGSRFFRSFRAALILMRIPRVPLRSIRLGGLSSRAPFARNTPQPRLEKPF
jgi:NADH dehydrogenase